LINQLKRIVENSESELGIGINVPNFPIPTKKERFHLAVSPTSYKDRGVRISTGNSYGVLNVLDGISLSRLIKH